MTNIIKLTLDETKLHILDNLKNMHHGKLVRYDLAILDLADFKFSNEALKSLIDENRVTTCNFSMTDKFDRKIPFTLYRYNYI